MYDVCVLTLLKAPLSFGRENAEKGFADVIEKFEKTERNSISLCIQSVTPTHFAFNPHARHLRLSNVRCSRTCYKLISIPLLQVNNFSI